MRYVSVCSGIEAASVAWHPLGWECAAVSEIEKFPSAVLAHHYPDVPNLGDLTRYADWPDLGPVDLLVGGTPCQSFSVAGLRQGLADPRGNLALVFLGLLDRLRPRWVVWENVPGVLSSSGGRDFGSFLGGLAELGYGWAYRVLDAQYFGVAQRRRRVFVVGYLGDWRPPVAVLFEPESLRGDTPPRREAGEGTAHRTAPSLTGSGRGVARPGESRGQDPVIAFDTQQITSKANRTRVAPGLPASTLNAAGQMHVAESITPAVANPLTARMHKGINTTCDEGQTMVAHTLRGTGHDASEDGTGRGTPLVAVTTLAIRGRGDGRNLETREDGLANAILTPNGGRDGMGVGAVAYPLDLRNAGRDPEKHDAQNRQGVGTGEDGDPSPTLSQAFVPGVVANGEPLYLQGITHTGDDDASPPETHAVTLLRRVRTALGEEAFAQWGLGILDSLQCSQVLQSAVHGHGIRPTPFSRRWVLDCTLACPGDRAARAMQSLREAGGEGCASPGPQLAEQHAGELGAYLSELSQPGAQIERFMHDLWGAAQGIGVLREALSAIQEIWHPTGVQAQSAHPFAVRRLTVTECEFLQGFPRHFTDIPYRGKPAADGNRYKALGNSMAVPVMRWIGERIAMVDALPKEAP